LRIGLELYDLAADLSETRNVAHVHPEVVERLRTVLAADREDLGDDRLNIQGRGRREPGRVAPE
jgi:hypothetical protein